MTVILSRDSLLALLGESPSEARWAQVGYEHCKADRHEVWLDMLIDLRRMAVQAGIEEPPAPERLVKLVERQAQVKRRNRYAYRW